MHFFSPLLFVTLALSISAMPANPKPGADVCVFSLPICTAARVVKNISNGGRV